jgi:hypothetical protein
MAEKKGIILTGHRPTGPRHIGHLVGTLEQWAKMQDDYDCLFTPSAPQWCVNPPSWSMPNWPRSLACSPL